MTFFLVNELLEHVASAIHVEGLAGDEVGVGGGEKEHRPDEVPPSSCRGTARALIWSFSISAGRSPSTGGVAVRPGVTRFT